MYKVEEFEKMVEQACEKNDYELYKKACCGLHLYLKLCPESKAERSCFVLFDALLNDKSQGFLNVVSEIISNDKDPSYGDMIVWALLLSVRVDSNPDMDLLLNMCDDIEDELLKKIVDRR